MKPSVLNHPALGQYMQALRAAYLATANEIRPWYRIENTAGTEATVYLHNEISLWGVTAEDFAREVAELDVSVINLHLNSPGGLVFDGIAIHNTLRDHKASVNVIVDGLAASIASVIAMAGDTVTMGRGTRMMIHNPRGLSIGEAKDMREYAELLDAAAEDMAGFYAERAGNEPADWRPVMDAETWYSAREAVDAGLADKVSGDDDTEAKESAGLMASTFRYTGREQAPEPSIQNSSQLIKARERARRGGVK